MINVRIKLIPPNTPGGEPLAVTTKVFLRDGSEIKNGCRPLEPGEVVSLPDAEANEALRRLPYELEMTLEKPTRPLYFKNADEANITSQFFNPNSQGRAEQAKQAMIQMWKDAKSPENEAAMEVMNDLEAREAAIIQKEIELGIREAPIDVEMGAELDEDLADYVAADNAMTDAELKEVRTAAAAEEREAEVVEEEPVETAPRQRRRRQAVA